MTDNGIKPCVILLTLYGPLYSNTVIGRPTLGGLLHGTAKRGQGGAAFPPGPPHFLLAVPNVTAHPSTASISISLILFALYLP